VKDTGQNGHVKRTAYTSMTVKDTRANSNNAWCH